MAEELFQRINSDIDKSLGLLRQGEVAEATAVVDLALGFNKPQKDLYYAKSLCSYATNDLDGTIQNLTQELKLFPNNENALKFKSALADETSSGSEEGSSEGAVTLGTSVEELVAASDENLTWKGDTLDLKSAFERSMSQCPEDAIKALTSLVNSDFTSFLDYSTRLLCQKNTVPVDSIKAIRKCLEASPKIFDQFYRRLISYSENSNKDANSLDGRLQGIVDDLKSDGIASWPGYITDESELNFLRQVCAVRTQNAKDAIASIDERQTTVSDPNFGCPLQLAYFPHLGRSRATYHANSAPVDPCLQRLMGESRFAQIASSYANARAELSYMMFERLEPAELANSWHVDTLQDDFKVMILLTDCEQVHGPLRFLKSTKHNMEVLSAIIFSTFCHGLNHAYPSNGLVKSLNLEPTYGVGKAGDAVLFDVGAIHSGTGCLQEHRDCVVLRYTMDNEKNRALQKLSSVAEH